MHNKLFKNVASVLGAALVLSSIVASIVPAQAATSTKGANGYETTYKLSDCPFDEVGSSAYGGGLEVIDSNAVTINYTRQFATAYYSIPQEVLDAGIIGFRFAPSVSIEQTEISLTADDSANKLILFAPAVAEMGTHMLGNGTDYNTQWQTHETWTEADLPEITKFGIGYRTEDVPCEVTVTDITFITKNAVGSGSSTGTTTTSAPKTGETMTMTYVVCILGGLLLLSVVGMVVTEQKKKRK